MRDSCQYCRVMVHLSPYTFPEQPSHTWPTGLLCPSPIPLLGGTYMECVWSGSGFPFLFTAVLQSLSGQCIKAVLFTLEQRVDPCSKKKKLIDPYVNLNYFYNKCRHITYALGYIKPKYMFNYKTNRTQIKNNNLMTDYFSVKPYCWHWVYY